MKITLNRKSKTIPYHELAKGTFYILDPEENCGKIHLRLKYSAREALVLEFDKNT